jgi:hypothetical protein
MPGTRASTKLIDQRQWSGSIPGSATKHLRDSCGEVERSLQAEKTDLASLTNNLYFTQHGLTSEQTPQACEIAWL